MWLGTEDGQILILDVISKQILFRRYLSVHSDQGIVGLYHLLSIRWVIIRDIKEGGVQIQILEIKGSNDS